MNNPNALETQLEDALADSDWLQRSNDELRKECAQLLKACQDEVAAHAVTKALLERSIRESEGLKSLYSAVPSWHAKALKRLNLNR